MTFMPSTSNVVTFEGTDEADLLRAAADWAAEHRDAAIVAINFRAFYNCPVESCEPVPGDSGKKLDIVYNG